MQRTGLRSASAISGTARRSSGEAQDELAQRLAVERRAAAEAVELGGHALGGVDQLVRLHVGRRRQAERDVARRGRPGARRGRCAITVPSSGSPTAPTSTSAPARHERLDDRAGPRPPGRLHPPLELAPARAHRRLAVEAEERRRRRRPRARAAGSRPSARSGRRSPPRRRPRASDVRAAAATRRWRCRGWRAGPPPSAALEPAAPPAVEPRRDQRAGRLGIEVGVARAAGPAAARATRAARRPRASTPAQASGKRKLGTPAGPVGAAGGRRRATTEATTGFGCPAAASAMAARTAPRIAAGRGRRSRP